MAQQLLTKTAIATAPAPTPLSASSIWRRNNPEKYKIHCATATAKRKAPVSVPKDVKTALTVCYHSAKTSAKIDNRVFKITKQDLYRKWVSQDGLCAKTGIPMQLTSGTIKARNNLRVSIDRKNNRLGYTKSNTRLVVWQYNNAKGTGTDQELDAFCRAYVQNN